MPKNLLLADDSKTIQQAVGMTFAGEDLSVVVVGDGEAALQAAKQSKPDLILADVSMPRLGGYELCQRVRADAALKDVPVLLLGGPTPIGPARPGVPPARPSGPPAIPKPAVSPGAAGTTMVMARPPVPGGAASRPISTPNAARPSAPPPPRPGTPAPPPAAARPSIPPARPPAAASRPPAPQGTRRPRAVLPAE